MAADRYRNRSAFELLVENGPADVIVSVMNHLDIPTFRLVIQVSRRLHTCGLEWLSRVRFFYGTWHVLYSDKHTFHGVGTSFNWNWHNRFPSRPYLLESLVRDFPQVPKADFCIGAFMEIDQKDEASRTFYFPGANVPPLLPLECARAKAREKKKRKLAAMLKD